MNRAAPPARSILLLLRLRHGEASWHPHPWPQPPEPRHTRTHTHARKRWRAFTGGGGPANSQEFPTIFRHSVRLPPVRERHQQFGPDNEPPSAGTMKTIKTPCKPPTCGVHFQGQFQQIARGLRERAAALSGADPSPAGPHAPSLPQGLLQKFSAGSASRSCRAAGGALGRGGTPPPPCPPPGPAPPGPPGPPERRQSRPQRLGRSRRHRWLRRGLARPAARPRQRRA